MARIKKERPDAKYRPTSKERLFRKGDQIITVTTDKQPAIVDFNDIVACCAIEPDNDVSAPWQDDDGWEHEVKNLNKIEHYSGCVRRWNPDHVVSVGNYENLLIVVSWDTVKQWQGDYCWDRGESKQVWWERLAACRRQAIEQLVHWRTYGWQAWGVACDFLDYTASLWGIWTKDDSECDPYLDEVKEELASDVAQQLENDGFTVVNQPDRKALYNSREYKQRALRWKIAHRFGFDKPEKYRAWIERRSEKPAYVRTFSIPSASC
jgi:hypothetical protein